MKSGFWIGSVLCAILLISNCKKPEVYTTAVVTIPSYKLETAADLDVLMNAIGNARIVLLGEASHGTAEYYNWRAEISKRLITEKGFDMIAVEGEWADSYRVNQFIKGPTKDSVQTISLLRQYDRWPTWMWGNYEVVSLVYWLNRHNQAKEAGSKVGFFGLDLYCLWESMQELKPYIQGNDSLMKMAAQVEKCFRPFSADPMEYAHAVLNADANCAALVNRLWLAVQDHTGRKTASDEAAFVMQQNVLVALNGENYYRTAIRSSTASWNIRDRHMMQTIQRLMEFHGPDTKLIVWEHNTHVGDARYTDMAGSGMVNVGQLVREAYPAQSFIVGFGSYKGSVIAADDWGGPIKNMRVPPAQKGSWEELLHRQGGIDQLLLSSELRSNEALMKHIGHRAIGVQYNPNSESVNYVPTIIPMRYDAFLYFDQTTALRPLGARAKNEPPDTYPTGY